jgi:hypothetical protein
MLARGAQPAVGLRGWGHLHAPHNLKSRARILIDSAGSGRHEETH